MRNDLAERVTDDYVFFYRGVFSQWYKRPITMDIFHYKDLTFNCAEQAMMASKAIYFKDDDMLHAIMDTLEPWEQKHYGKRVRPFDKEAWESVCRDLVYNINLVKFTTHPDLKEDILRTGQ